jgi:hypothetical protein
MARAWATGMATYDKLLAGLAEVKAAPRDEGAGGGDDRGAQAPAASSAADAKAARKAAKAAKRAAKAAKAAEAAAAAAAAAPPPPKASHLARFSRRRAGKAVGGYSASDLAAVLGVAAPAEGAARVERASPPPRAEAPPPAPSSPSPPHTPAWWAGAFTRARARLGAAPQPPAARRPIGGAPGFTEADQEALATRAAAGGRSGRVGLGVEKKVGGARWAGTRTALGSDDEEQGEEGGDAEPEAELPATASLEEDAGILILPPRRRAAAAAAPAPLPKSAKGAARAALAGGALPRAALVAAMQEALACGAAAAAAAVDALTAKGSVAADAGGALGLPPRKKQRR